MIPAKTGILLEYKDVNQEVKPLYGGKENENQSQHYSFKHVSSVQHS